MEKLNPPEELQSLHEMMVNPSSSAVEYEREIIRAFEQAVGVEVYSEEISFQEMFALLEKAAEEK